MDTLSRLKSGRRRKAVTLNEADLVNESGYGGQGLPVIITPAAEPLDLAVWSGRNRSRIQNGLDHKGAVLLRGFGLDGVAGFQNLVSAFSGESLLEYTYRSTVRSRVRGRIYTSTEYPADQTIPQHNENAYTNLWPGRLYFYCLTRPGRGGETPVADSAAVYERLDPHIRERFQQHGVLYVRNYHRDMDIPWQTVFQTEDPAEVSRFCEERDMECIWKPDGGLQTRQRCQAVIQHPVTGKTVWFNQAHLFHVSNLNPEIAASMINDFGLDGLPRNAYYGDGQPIEADVLAQIRQAYTQEEIAFPWQQGDVMIIDNMRVTHGRRPFGGERKIVVGMSGVWSAEQDGNARKTEAAS